MFSVAQQSNSLVWLCFIFTQVQTFTCKFSDFCFQWPWCSAFCRVPYNVHRNLRCFQCNPKRWFLLYYRIKTQWRTENSFKLPSSSSVRNIVPPCPPVSPGNTWCLGSLRTADGVEANKCSADAMSRCTDPLKVVTDNKDLGFATSKDELDEMCP